MFKNFYLITIRNLQRQKLFSAINILGLAIGLTACLLVLTFVLDELSYDEFHSNKSRIYRLTWEQDRNGDLFKYAMMPFPAKYVLEENLPEVEQVTRLYSNNRVGGNIKIKFNEEEDYEDGIMMVDENFFQVFDFELVNGDPKTALSNVNGIVLTESMALKYFGDQDPIGQMIAYDDRDRLEVTGVLKDVPNNSHIQFDFLMRVEHLRQDWTQRYGYDFEADWKWSGATTYILRKKNSLLGSLQQKLTGVVTDHIADQTKREIQLNLQSFEDIYLHSDFKGEIGQTGNYQQLKMFVWVAIAILFIASINFMNLSTARSVKRAREVGIRKVLGARRRQLVYQFLGEAISIAFIALIHSFLILNLTLPLFNKFTGKTFEFEKVIFDPEILMGSLVITLLVGVISGLYPAGFLSGFAALRLQRSGLKSGTGLGVRRILVLLQFIISIVFISGILNISKQLDYLRNADLGYDQDMLITLPDEGDVISRFEPFRNQLLQNSSVTDVYRGQVIGRGAWGNTVIPEGFAKDEGISVSLLYMGYDLISTFNLDLISGRDFDRAMDKDDQNERSSFILNQVAIERFGWSDNVVGKEIQWIGGNDNKTLIKGQVVGVVRDFHYKSLYEKIDPLVIKLSNWGTVAVKLKPYEVAKTLDAIEETWEQFASDRPFEYTFLDEHLDEQYKKEEKLSAVMKYFTGLAIFISCLGVFGLVTFMAEQKKKEIAIRKTLGASIKQLVLLLSNEFTRLVLIAGIVATPIAYWFIENWLQNFAYRTKIGLMAFAYAGFASLVIAFLTIGLQAFKSATENPTESLRNE